jgi:hypothetical protein
MLALAAAGNGCADDSVNLLGALDLRSDEMVSGDAAVASCSDGKRNGAETDVDCGGPDCPGCADGAACSQASDCRSAVCVMGICQAANCSDGIRDGLETDVDCGGPACPACATGKRCDRAADCASLWCTSHVCVVPPLRFISGNDFGAGREPVAMVSADLDGDGLLDLAIADRANGNFNDTMITVLHGTGDARFTSGKSFTVGPAVCQVAAADFNRDKKIDLAIGHCAGAFMAPDLVEVWLGDGKGAFALVNGYPILGHLTSMTVGDLDGDGRPDVVAGSDSGNVCVLLGDANGILKNVTGYLASAGVDVGPLAIGDLDGDGRDDVAAVVAGGLRWWLSTAKGALTPGGSLADTFTTVALADLDGDGNADVAAGRGKGIEVAILMNDGKGHHLSPGAQLGLADQYATAATLVDVNADGRPDLLVSDYMGGLESFLGRGGGKFAAPTTSGGSFDLLRTGDFDADGLIDVALLDSHDGLVRVLRGRGDGGFVGGTALPAPGVMPIAGDWNRDGKTDLASPDGMGAVVVLQNDGKGHFGAPVKFPAGTNPDDLASGDLDGDGNVDFVVAGRSGNQGTLILLAGKGDGSFGAPQTLLSDARFHGFAIGDFNRDGHLDVAAGRTTDVAVLIGSGGGIFGPAQGFDSGCNEVDGIAAGDLDKDGRADLVVSCADRLAVLLAKMGGGFQAARKVLDQGAGVTLGDFDADGINDIVGASSQQGLGNLAVLLGKGGGLFGAPTFVPVFGDLGRVLFADFNKDKSLDVAVAAVGEARVLLGDGTGKLGPPLGIATASPGASVGIAAADFDGDGWIDLAIGGKDITLAINAGK